MKIIAVANVEQQQEILEKKINAGAEIIFVKNLNEIIDSDDYDALLMLDENTDLSAPEVLTAKPVMINSVIETLEGFPGNFCRINGWSGFLKREVWEVAAGSNKEAFSKIFDILGWKVLFVKDEPGLVAARVIAMIINEAYFALGGQVSSVKDIDLAMQLGTNYPQGPFEWCKRIGVENIFKLLSKLTEMNKRYLVAPELKEQFSLLSR
ncbi:MAG TPA: 3-hydroxyacyl-CoA dehydrogenase family protein [Chitinophagaceae bacterium]|nr:3-hydroxyacyl-CoA dehydrogenase family protein [Chitinophagaceae bacterium]